MENLNNVINILKEIENNSSSKKKLEILAKNKDNELLRKIFEYTYNKVKRVYNVKSKSILEFNQSNNFGMDLTDENSLFTVLETLNNRTYTGHNALMLCKALLENNRDYDGFNSMFLKVIDRDLNVGINDKSLNKVWVDIVPNPKYCRCDIFNTKNIKKFEFPAYIQLKCDGTYREVRVLNGEVFIRTRSGETYTNPVIEEQMRDLPNGYYMGEFTLGEANKQFDRFNANGNINSDNPDYKNIHFTMWDYLDENQYNNGVNVPYYLRLNALNDIIQIARRKAILKGANLHVVETKEVNDIDEALAIVSSWMCLGLEGGVLKAMNASFKDGTSKEQLKIKLNIDLEVRCKEFILGTKGTKYEGKNKVIVFENDEGTIKGQCSGMTDAMVDAVTKNQNKYIGKVLTVQFNDLVKSDSNDYYALSHPRFIEWRDDKDETDTLEKAFKLKDMATQLN